MLEIRLLGTPAFTHDGIALAELSASPLLCSLAAYLVLNRDQAQPRAVLASALWPEKVESTARQNLNAQLWRLRVALKRASDSSQPSLLADKQNVQWNRAALFWLDVAEFEGATEGLSATGHSPSQGSADISRLEAALALYRGDLLEGIYDDWVLPHRERLRERYLLALQALASAHEANERFEQALHTMRRLVDAEPLREAAHARLIELCVAAGQPGEARALFERYAVLWRDELNLAPSSAMAELAHRHRLEVKPELQAPIAPSQAIAALTKEAKRTRGAPESRQSARTLRRELRICRQFDPLYDVIGDRRRQAGNLQRMEHIAQRLNDASAQIEVLARRAWLAMRQSDYREARLLCNRALERLASVRKPARGPTLEATVRRLAGIALHETGDIVAALDQYAQAMALDEAEGNTAALPANLTNRAAAAIALADYTSAIADLECALQHKPARSLQPRILGNLGIAWMWLGELQRAAGYLRQAMQQAQRNGDRDDEGWVAAFLAILHHLDGHTQDGILMAEHYCRSTLEAGAGGAWMKALFADALAMLYLAAGDAERASLHSQEAVRIARCKGLWRYEVRGIMRLAEAHFQLGKLRQALSDARKAVELYSQKDQHLQEEPEVFLTLANAARAAERWREANEAQTRADEGLERQADRIADCELRKSFLAFQRRTPGCMVMFRMRA